MRMKSKDVSMICPSCGKDTKTRGHIMTECLTSHRLTINVSKESQKRPSFDTMLNNLRRVPMGKFMRDAAKEMEHLPFVITKDGTDFAIVGPIKGSET